MDGLLDHRTALREREEQLSYWRRVVQGRLDILTARLAGTDAALADVLGVQGQASTRLAHNEVRHVEPMLELATTDRAWDLAVDSSDAPLIQHTVHRLAAAERWLSEQRTTVFCELDCATAELGSRLVSNPLEYLHSVERRLPPGG
jgi:hypothetical protein